MFYRMTWKVHGDTFVTISLWEHSYTVREPLLWEQYDCSVQLFSVFIVQLPF